MNWISIDSQQGLDSFSESVCWEDSDTLEFYATLANESFFPTDISRSGGFNMNVHILIDACSSEARYLEMVFVDCDHASPHYLTNTFIAGRIDSLKRIEVFDWKNDLVMRCSRLIYRFLDEAPALRSGRYFRNKNLNTEQQL
jgi:hypothetical protein